MTGPVAFTMPKWGIEMAEGVLLEWGLSEGQDFKRGDLLAVIESDKITNEVEAEFDGTLRRRLAVTGDSYKVGALLGVFAPADITDAEIDRFIAGFGGALPLAAEPVAPARSAVVPPSPPPSITVRDDLPISPAARRHAVALSVDPEGLTGSGRGGRITFQDVDQAARPPAPPPPAMAVDISLKTAALEAVFASPLAKRLALQNEVDIAALKGTGPHGRISKADVMAEIAKPSAVTIIPMSPTRRTIARRLVLSKTTIPHFYLRLEVAADALLAHRQAANAMDPGNPRSLNDYLLRAAALALIEVPEINIQVHGDSIHRFADADITVAVATERGLFAPVLRAVQTMPLPTVASATRALVARARAGTLTAEEVGGGSFSLTNLGMFGVGQFDAIVNPPQGAILAVGAVRPGMVGEDQPRWGKVMSLSLSCDHRAIDGAEGGRFLQALRRRIETPDLLT